MLLRHLCALVALALAPISAAGAQSIAIHPGEDVTIRFEGGRAVVAQRGNAGPVTQFEAAVIPNLQLQSKQLPEGTTIAPPQPVYESDIRAPPPSVTENEVHLIFRHVASLDQGQSGDSILSLTNGYGQAFRYRATMHSNGKSAPTDVCEVMPANRGIEHWPYVIEWLDLTELRLEPFKTGAIRCE
jgi:hypothetical protein